MLCTHRANQNEQARQKVGQSLSVIVLATQRSLCGIATQSFSGNCSRRANKFIETERLRLYEQSPGAQRLEKPDLFS